MARSIKLDIPSTIFVRTVAGEAIQWDVDKTPDNVIRDILVRGGLTVLLNVFNGGGKDATETEKLAALTKKLDAWYRGEFSVVERGESQYTAMRDVYMADCMAAGLTGKQAETGLKEKVAEYLGDAKATFANFIEASAVEAVKAGDMTRDEARGALESYYASEVDRRAKERAKAGSKIELPKIDLSAFAKKA